LSEDGIADPSDVAADCGVLAAVPALLNSVKVSPARAK
jgi:hypothetical protein